MTDYVHIHYKWFRFDFTSDEFLEFSVIESSERLKKEFNLNEIPKRTGKFHDPCPKEKLIKKEMEHFGLIWEIILILKILLKQSMLMMIKKHRKETMIYLK